MNKYSVSYVRNPIAIRNAARAINRMAGRFNGDLDLRQETIQGLLSSALLRLPLNRGEGNGRYL